MRHPASTEQLLADLATLATAEGTWSTLPPGVYASEDIFDLEADRIFRPGWINIGHVSQIPNAGDYRAVDTVGELLVMTRDRTGEIHVMSRACTHRWMDLTGGPGSGCVPSIQCPYHKWTYRLDGTLLAAPEMENTPGFERHDHGLHRYRNEIWQGFVFVNLDGDAPATSELWGPLSNQINEYGLSDWAVVSSIAWGESAWDWKVFIDNGECYHHLGIHHDTLEPFMPARRAVDLADNGAYTLIHAGVDPALLDRDADGELDYPSADPAVPGLTTQQRTGLGLAYPFPNYVIALLPQSAFWFEVHPIGAGRIDFTSHLLLPPHLLDAPDMDQRVAEHNAAFETIHQQDIVVCEGVQRGLSTPAARSGMLAHLEQHNRTFARWYARQMVD